MSVVLVLAGGDSSEREVSLRSGSAVAQALKASGHTVHLADPSVKLHDTPHPDVIFPVLHGKGGEDGTIQAQLENMNIPFVGSSATASEKCFNKWNYKQLLQDHGLPVADGSLVGRETLWQSPLASQPFVLKPFDGGSSVDTFIVRKPANADRAVLGESFARNKKMLLEALVEGTEITVGVLGDQALPVVEIIPPAGGEFDYENKYNGKTQELCPPQHISQALQRQAQDLALQAHRLSGCQDFSRTDMIITPQGTIIILETNTIPGMTEESLFPKAAAAYGLSMPELVDRLVRMALARAQRPTS